MPELSPHKKKRAEAELARIEADESSWQGLNRREARNVYARCPQGLRDRIDNLMRACDVPLSRAVEVTLQVNDENIKRTLENVLQNGLDDEGCVIYGDETHA